LRRPPAQALPVLALLLLAASTIGCDRFTKRLATAELRGSPARSFLGDTLRLTYTENEGAFLGLGSGLPPSVRFWVLTGGAAVALGALLWMPRRTRLGPAGWVGLSLVLAGGFSNFWDRFHHGAVVDFLNLGVGPLRTGIFNVADMAITLGVVLVVMAARWPEPPRAPAK
jgi:signal peptidase II